MKKTLCSIISSIALTACTLPQMTASQDYTMQINTMSVKHSIQSEPSPVCSYDDVTSSKEGFLFTEDIGKKHPVKYGVMHYEQGCFIEFLGSPTKFKDVDGISIYIRGAENCQMLKNIFIFETEQGTIEVKRFALDMYEMTPERNPIPEFLKEEVDKADSKLRAYRSRPDVCKALKEYQIK